MHISSSKSLSPPGTSARRDASTCGPVHKLLFTALIWLCGTVSQIAAAVEIAEFTEDRITPPLALNDMHGKPHDLADYRGKVVLVNFWAGWCFPCLQEIPDLIKLAEALEDKPFKILAVNVAEEKKLSGYGFVDKMDEHMVILMDNESKAFEQWKGIGLPSTFVVDPAGVVRYEAYGPVNWARQDVVAAFEALMQEDSSDQEASKQ